MNESVRQKLVESLDFLQELARDNVRPSEARARLRRLQERHTDTELDLVWEEEAYDGSIHYDTLLHVAGEGTISLSFAPEGDLPWPLRGIQRWSDKDLVRVNNTLLSVDQAIAHLDFIWENVPVLNGLVNHCLIQAALDEEPVSVSDEDVQRALDAFRRAKKLYTAEDTRRWMERRGMTHEMLERHVAEAARIAKLRERVAAGRVEQYFEAHRADYDLVLVARLEFPGEEQARRAGAQIQNGTIDFYEAAQRLFLAKAERGGTGETALFASLPRGELLTEWEPVFVTSPGKVVGPLPMNGGRYALVQVLSVVPARLDDSTRDAVMRDLFDEWLAEQRRTARIEWNWGDASQTVEAIQGSR